MKKVSRRPRRSLSPEEKAFRILRGLGPLFGAIGLGTVTMYGNWFAGSRDLHGGRWESVYPFLMSIAFAVIVGALLGGAIAESAEHRAAQRIHLATDTCFRWAIAVTALFVLLPFAKFDDNLPRLGEAYADLIRSQGAAMMLTLAIYVRGFLLLRYEARQARSRDFA